MELESVPHVFSMALLTPTDATRFAWFVLLPALHTAIWTLGPDEFVSSLTRLLVANDFSYLWHPFTSVQDRITFLLLCRA
jgi:hypothetical protein